MLLLLVSLVSSTTLTGATPSAAPAPDAGGESRIESVASPSPVLDNESGAAEFRTQSSDGVEIDSNLQTASGREEVVVRLSEPIGSLGDTRTESVATLKEHANATQDDVEQFAATTDGVTLEQRFWITNAVLLRVDTDRVSLDEIARVRGVERLHRNYQVDSLSADTVSPRSAATAPEALTTTPNATYGLDMVGAPETWTDYGTRGENVRVAVLDTGIDADHQDLDLYTTNESDPTYPGGWAEFNSTGDRISGSEPFDNDGHGTHVSGTVGGENASGEYIGVAPNTELMHGSVLGPDGGTFTAVASGMQWAVENDADVISMSLGPAGGGFVDDMISPVRNARSQGVVVIAAIGNSGEGTSGSPGNVYETLGVGAVDPYADVPSFSSGQVVDTSENWSSPPSEWPEEYVTPDVAAPGVDIKSSVPGGGYDGTYDGTSMATPHVAGASALIISKNGNLSPTDVKYVLRETSWKPDGEPAGNDTRYGAGIIDAHAAVDAVTSSDLNGSVVGSAGGDGIENATITVTNASSGKIVANATTDASGVYTAELPARGNFSIAADATFDNATVTREVGLAEDLTNVTITVDNDITVNGTVAEANTDAPIESASVTVRQPMEFVQRNTTNRRGYFEVNVAPGAATSELSTKVAATGYHTETLAAPIDGDTDPTLDVALVGNASISAHVVDNATGEDVADANVTTTRGTVTYNATTDSTGNFTLSELPGAAEYNLTVSAADYYDANRSLSVNDSEDAALGDVPFEPETTIAGTVTDAGLDEPLANATVTVERNGSVVTVATDENGTYAVAIDAGPTNVTVDKTGFHANLTENVSIDHGDDVVHEVALEAKNGSIAGQVVATDTDEALPNASVAVETVDGSAFATPPVDENGTYAVSEVPRGEYALTTSRGDFYPRSENVTVGPGENVTRAVELEPKPATVEGVLVDGDGEPLSNATVTATGNRSLARTATDANGTYSLSLARGEYALTYEKLAYETAETTIDPSANETVTDANASIARLPVFFDVVSVDAPGSVEQGDRVSVSAAVENLGTDNGSRIVAYRFAGERVDGANVTIANGSSATIELTYDVPDDSPTGDHEHVVAADTTATGAIQVEEASDDGGGGGGGGGGDLPPPSTWVETAPADAGGTTISVRSGYADTPARADFETAAGAVTVTGASIHYASDVTRSDVRVTPSETTAAEPPAAPITSVGYLVTATEFGNASAVDRIAVDLSVDPSSLPQSADAGDVRVYRSAAGGWEGVSTSERGGTVTAALEPDAEYAVAVDESALGSDDQDGDDSGETSTAGDSDDDATEASEPDEPGDGAATGDDESHESTSEETGGSESGDDSSLPGFGPLAALFALLSGAVVRRRTAD